jgi:hypothetical protein
VGAAVAQALAAVHAAGLVHRDVKPANVIDANGVYKLIDFGIALRPRAARAATTLVRSIPPPSIPPAATIEAGDATLPVSSVVGTAETMTGVTSDTIEDRSPAGTMGYIDPACIGREQPADASSDLYSLGAMLYECLTGRVPASAGESRVPTRLRADVLLGVSPPTPVKQLAPHVPEPVAALVESLLAPVREKRPRRAEAVASELGRLSRASKGVSTPLPPEGPFLGLLPVSGRHRDVYFGRSEAIAAATALLRSRGLLVHVGPSGAGKTSLALAGVLPAVADGALGAWPATWRMKTLSPGRTPRAALAEALAMPTALTLEPDAFVASLADDVDTSGVGLLVYIDALEELVTVSGPDEVPWFAAFLSAAAERPRPGLRVVCTTRRDLLDPLLAKPGLGAALTRSMQLVPPLGAGAWIDSVRERLGAYGFSLEEGIELDLAGELGDDAVPLPLVEFAIARLWRERDEERRVLPRAALAAMGGVAGALARHADVALGALVSRHGPAAEAVAREVLVALTTPHGTRARLSRAELAERVPHALRDDVLEELAKARLVTVDDDITLAHDTLATRWPRLHGWIEAVRRDREIATDVEAAAVRYRARPGRESLLRGRVLADGRAVEAAGVVGLSADARELLRASRRDEIRSRVGIIGFASSIGVAAVVLGTVYASSARDTREEKEQAAAITRTILDARNHPKSEVAKKMEDLVSQKFACERELAKCTGRDGGL